MDCTPLLRALALVAFTASSASADIYQWEWVDPNDHSLGKRQSTTLCPGGAGADPSVYQGLSHRDLTQAYLYGLDFHTSIWNAKLHDAYLADSKLDGTFFQQLTMLGADLSGTSFRDCFQNGYSRMDRANFTDADLTGTFFRYSYLNDVNFTRANLTNVTFEATDLTGATFTDAKIAGAHLTYARQGFTAEQLYSTGSYRERDLRRTRLPMYADLQGWNFDDVDLSNAVFYNTDIANASFQHARLDRTTFTGSNVVGTDFRGAVDATNLNLAPRDRAILPDGTLHTVEGRGVLVRNFADDIGIHITGAVTDGGFDMLFDDPPWNSTISFEPGIPVELGETRSLAFEPGTLSPDMIGRSFHVFDWTGIDRVGEFQIETNGLSWDTSRLYSDGIVTLTAIPEPTCLWLLAMILTPRPRRV